jgi:hypothetical protein
MPGRPKIYVLLTNIPILTKTTGYEINEMILCFLMR